MVLIKLFAGEQWRRIEDRPMDMELEEEGEGTMYAENNMETYITICKTDSQWNLLDDSGNSNRGSATT